MPVRASGSKSFPSELLRESPTSTGRPSASRTSRRRISSKFCAAVLPKPMPGIEADALLRDPGRDGERQPLLEKGGDLRCDVVVARVGLHRPRLALHVHQAQVGASVGDHARELGVAAERRHVVDELGAERERTPRHLALRGVDRDGQPFETLEDRDHPAQLLVERDAVRAGPRRLAADVHDRRAFLDHPASRRRRGVRIQVRAAVREAVGRHVHDPHHGGALQTFLHRWTSHPAMESSHAWAARLC